MSNDPNVKLQKKDLVKLDGKKLHPKPFKGSGNYRTKKWINNQYKIRVQSIPVIVPVQILFKSLRPGIKYDKITVSGVKYIHQDHYVSRV